MENRVFVIGLDGFPYWLSESHVIRKSMPFFSTLCRQYGLRPMRSVLPTVSSVAWTSYATGCNPAEHGILGFTDRDPRSLQLFIPTSSHRRKDPIWNKLPANRQAVVINVPITYPPEPIRGQMVSCFLCPQIDAGVYPQSLAYELQRMGYIIDVDAPVPGQDLGPFVDRLIFAMQKRFELALKLLKGPWHYFQLHIMETDRLMHFAMDQLLTEKEDSLNKRIQCFWNQLDSWIKALHEELDRLQCTWILLSDHGFCRIESEVELNRWLRLRGWLSFTNDENSLRFLHPNSICYSLTPGRVYLNLAGREKNGRVPPAEYYRVRAWIKDNLLSLRHPVTNRRVMTDVLDREAVFHGPLEDRAPDLICQPADGFDLKSSFEEGEIFTKSHRSGMHTYTDAIVMSKGIDLRNISGIEDIYKPTVAYLNQ